MVAIKFLDQSLNLVRSFPGTNENEVDYEILFSPILEFGSVFLNLRIECGSFRQVLLVFKKLKVCKERLYFCLRYRISLSNFRVFALDYVDFIGLLRLENNIDACIIDSDYASIMIIICSRIAFSK